MAADLRQFHRYIVSLVFFLKPTPRELDLVTHWRFSHTFITVRRGQRVGNLPESKGRLGKRWRDG